VHETEAEAIATALLDALAGDFAARGFDLRHLERTILNYLCQFVASGVADGDLSRCYGLYADADEVWDGDLRAELEAIQMRLAGPPAEPLKAEKRHARPKRGA